MHPSEFATKWHALAPRTTEIAAYQEHWRDLCALLGEPTPSSDATGQHYAFEKPVRKVGTGEAGRADVFLRDRFIVEYKGHGKDLGRAMQQAFLYARELGNPPLIMASDLVRFNIATNFTGSVPRNLSLTLDDVARDATLDDFDGLTALGALQAMFHEPDRLHPRHLRERVTRAATAQVGAVARELRARGADARQVAHFLMRLVFAMFSEDVGMLDRGLLTKVLERSRSHPERSRGYFQELFTAMQHGGEFWGHDIRHFNGGLFDSGLALELTQPDADALLQAAKLDWSNVEPAIFGTLFENSLEAVERGRLGAHYTSVSDILRITEPVLMEPLRREWQDVKVRAEALTRTKRGKGEAITALQDFQTRLASLAVLDPACGSGNFLVVALGQLLDLEHEVRELGRELGAGPFAMPPRVHPQQMRGIEIEPFAHELASVSTWISYIQWKKAHGGQWESPVLRSLANIENRDALLTPDGQEAQWPEAEFIMGNPPFVGGKKLRTKLGDAQVERLFRAYDGRVPREADLVTYWPEKARAALAAGTTRHAGFVTTQAIRTGANRAVLEQILATGRIHTAWPNEPWLQDGADVRVSLFAFDASESGNAHLGGVPVPAINASLSAQVDTRTARPLHENAGLMFMGTTKVGPFDIPATLARMWLDQPNPAGISNSDVVRPWANGSDIVRRPSDRWIIDFGVMPELQARQYVAPFAYVEAHVRPERVNNNRAAYRERWWQHAEARPALRAAVVGLQRLLLTPRVAKHRIWAWGAAGTVPDSRLFAVARDDAFTFGVLQSRVHEIWSLANSAAHGVGNDPTYVAKTCFDPFPFPHLTSEQRQVIDTWADYVTSMRGHLLTLSDKATLTGIYNDVERLRAVPDAAHPASALVVAHDRLNAAVAAAYGWAWPLTDDEILARLLALNLERSAAEDGPIR